MCKESEAVTNADFRNLRQEPGSAHPRERAGERRNRHLYPRSCRRSTGQKTSS